MSPFALDGKSISSLALPVNPPFSLSYFSFKAALSSGEAYCKESESNPVLIPFIFASKSASDFADKDSTETPVLAACLI